MSSRIQYVLYIRDGGKAHRFERFNTLERALSAQSKLYLTHTQESAIGRQIGRDMDGDLESFFKALSRQRNTKPPVSFDPGGQAP